MTVLVDLSSVDGTDVQVKDSFGLNSTGNTTSTNTNTWYDVRVVMDGSTVTVWRGYKGQGL